MKNKKVVVLDMVIIILAVIFVMILLATIVEIQDSNSNYTYGTDSFIYRIEEEDYAELVTMYYNNCGSDGKEQKNMREYYDLAKYFEAAFHHKMYTESGDTVRAEKYKTIMDETEARMGEFGFVADMMDEKLAAILSLSAWGEESNGTVEFSVEDNDTEFVLGSNLSSAISELALMYDEFDSAQTKEDYYPQSFIFHFCQNSRRTFDHLEQLREEKNGILSVEDVEYIQQSLTGEMVDMGNIVPEEGLDINQSASGVSFGNILSYEADVLGEEVHLVAEFEKGTDEFHPTKLYELDIVLIQNPESCFDGYSIMSLNSKELTPS